MIRVMSVSIQPGQTQFTRTPGPEHERELLRQADDAVLSRYVRARAAEADETATDAVLTIAPPPPMASPRGGSRRAAEIYGYAASSQPPADAGVVDHDVSRPKASTASSRWQQLFFPRDVQQACRPTPVC
jgi:hypothetical protein